ncbi:MAG: STAS domain-containing protein [Bacteroidales bacterium]
MLAVNYDQDYCRLSFPKLMKFNIHNAKEVEQDLMQYICKPHSCVVLDMKSVAFVDSSAFECLLNIERNAKIYNAEFRLERVSDDILDIIKVVQLDNVFNIITEEESEAS